MDSNTSLDIPENLLKNQLSRKIQKIDEKTKTLSEEEYNINLGELEKYVKEAMFDIPYGNTNFMNDALVLGECLTPERVYKSCGLELEARIKQIKGFLIQKEKEKIDIEEAEWFIDNGKDTIFDIKRRKLDLLLLKSNISDIDKKINDVMHEISYYYGVLKQFPKLSRDEYEAAEHSWHEKNLLKQSEYSGVRGTLKTLGDQKKFNKEIEQFLEKNAHRLEYNKPESMIKDIEKKLLSDD